MSVPPVATPGTPPPPCSSAMRVEFSGPSYQELCLCPEVLLRCPPELPTQEILLWPSEPVIGCPRWGRSQVSHHRCCPFFLTKRRRERSSQIKKSKEPGNSTKPQPVMALFPLSMTSHTPSAPPAMLRKTTRRPCSIFGKPHCGSSVVV